MLSNKQLDNHTLYRYFSSTRLMSPGYRLGPLPDEYENEKQSRIGSLVEEQMSATPRYVGPLGRHAHTLAFGSAPLTKVILFNNSGTTNPSDGGGVVDSIIKRAQG
jgi:hypothetical protein